MPDRFSERLDASWRARDKIRKNLFSERIGHKWDDSWITF